MPALPFQPILRCLTCLSCLTLEHTPPLVMSSARRDLGATKRTGADGKWDIGVRSWTMRLAIEALLPYRAAEADRRRRAS